jgi:hypothetical protein
MPNDGFPSFIHFDTPDNLYLGLYVITVLRKKPQSWRLLAAASLELAVMKAHNDIIHPACKEKK